MSTSSGDSHDFESPGYLRLDSSGICQWQIFPGHRFLSAVLAIKSHKIGVIKHDSHISGSCDG